MTGPQIRAARGLIGWSAQRLANVSKVSLATIQRAEKDNGDMRMIAANTEAVRRTLEEAGVEFIPENGGGAGVRMKDKRM